MKAEFLQNSVDAQGLADRLGAVDTDLVVAHVELLQHGAYTQKTGDCLTPRLAVNAPSPSPVPEVEHGGRPRRLHQARRLQLLLNALRNAELL